MILTEIQKFEIISKYNNEWSITKIANSMKINRHTVSTWIKRYNETGTIDRKIGSGLHKCKNIKNNINKEVNN